MVRNPAASSADAAVLCAGCGGWFLPESPPVPPGTRARCPLCDAPIVIGPLHRTKSRVARTGDVALPRDVADRATRRARALRVAAAVLVLVGVVAAASLLADEAVARWDSVRERLAGKSERPR